MFHGRTTGVSVCVCVSVCVSVTPPVRCIHNSLFTAEFVRFRQLHCSADGRSEGSMYRTVTVKLTRLLQVSVETCQHAICNQCLRCLRTPGFTGFTGREH